MALSDDDGDETGDTRAGDGKAYGADDRVFAVTVVECKVEIKEWGEERDKREGRKGKRVYLLADAVPADLTR